MHEGKGEGNKFILLRIPQLRNSIHPKRQRRQKNVSYQQGRGQVTSASKVQAEG
jgi:hypothetical protein